MPLPPQTAIAGSPITGLSQEAETLLMSLEAARDLFARRLVQEHHDIAEQDLNYRILSSILQALFLRTAQECGVVESDTLDLLAESDDISKRMAMVCSDAGLPPEIFFEQGPDSSYSLPVVPDAALRNFIGRINTPDIPAPLSVIPPEELSIIFEHFLGTRVQLAEGYRVKKAGKSAMLYTGTIDVPAQQVISVMVKGILPGAQLDASRGTKRPVRILDPACGAGIFLIAAYRFLTGQGNDPAIVLSRSIFGTDIDPESVSAARLVLLLAFIGDCRRIGAVPAGRDEIRTVAESLVRSIRCGNALIAPDYFAGRQVHPFNAEERRRVNAFSWQESFPEILTSGGFDAVIGAPPPYRPFLIRAREEYFQTHYNAYAEGAGLYTFFTERALSLVRPGGRIAFLVPASFLRSDSARPLRRLLLTHRILQIADTGTTRLLQDGGAGMYILSLENEPPGGAFTVVRLGAGTGRAGTGSGPGRELLIDQRALTDGGWVLADRRAAGIAERLRICGMSLDHYVMEEIRSGTVQDIPKIIFPEYTHIPIFTYDRTGSRACGESHLAIERDDPYLAGILNSTLARFLIAALCPRTDRGYHLSPACLGKFPVITPDFDRFADKARHDRIVALVTQMLALNEYLQKAKTDQEMRLVQQEIDATDVKIDALVYELYGLTAEEIAVVEESTRSIQG